MVKRAVDGTRRMVVSAVLVGMVAGCAAGPDFRRPEPPAASTYLPGAQPSGTAAYRQTVLQGLQEVADALSALDMDARALQARADAAEHARAGYEIARQQYLLGGISHLALLDAQRQLLQSEFDRVQAQADRYADTAALLHALRVGEVHAALSSRPAGLSPAEVAERLRRHGPNAPRSFRPDSSGTASCGPGSRRRWGCCS